METLYQSLSDGSYSLTLL